MTSPAFDSHSHWMRPREVYHWVHSPYQVDLELTFPKPLANIISQYANYTLGKNSKLWYIALINLGVVPDRIPPLPQNIHEILQRDCPMHRNTPNADGTYKKIEETHFLCLIPAGRIDALAQRKFGSEHKSPYLSAYHYGPSLHEPDMTSFDEPEWAMISNVLFPRSENLTYEQHGEMVRNFRETTEINYEIPSFKHTLAANLLFAAAEKKGLWGESLGCRVQETFYWNSHNLKEALYAPSCLIKRNLVIVDPYSIASPEIGIDHARCEFISEKLGIAILWKITKPTPISSASCAVS